MSGPVETVREQMRRVLREGPATSKDLSRVLGIRENDVAGHLEHLKRSLKRTRERLEIEPATCVECGFAFTHRTRYTRPGHCPRCKSTRTTLPVFSIQEP